MGLLDQLTNLSPEQNQGLLAAAAQMLQASGPSRMPTSFGQVLGQGIGTYQNAMTAQQEAAQRQAIFEQAQALNGFKLKDAESDFKAQEAQRDEARRYAEFMRNRGAGGATAPMPAGQSAAAAFAGAMNPQQAQPQTAEPAPSTAGGNMKIYQQRLALAEELRNAGFPTQADAAEAAALKFMPEVKDLKTVNVGGKTLYVPIYKDGSPGQPVPYEVAEKLEFKNTGGKTLGLNPFTGSTVTSYNNTMSPDAAAADRLGRDRLNFEKNKETKPVFNAEIGGFVSLPTKAAPNGAITPLAGYTKPDKPLTESQGKASLFASRMDKANQTLEQLAGDKQNPVLNSGSIKRFAEGTGTVLGLGTESLGGTLSGVLGSATNWTQSKEQQKVEQAKRDFLSAALRMESGAVIGPKEIADADRQYFPQPGDDEETLAQKAENRRTAIAGMALQSGGGAAKLIGNKPKTNNGWTITKVN